MRRLPLSLLACIALFGCKMHIGDSCGSSVDCSVTGERQCDLSQPGGYCTVFSCDPDTCPEGACVEWRYIPGRTAQTWCMKTCDNDGWCRRDYACVFPDQITAEGAVVGNETVPLSERVARIIDLNTFRAEAKICAAVVRVEPDTPLDGGM